MIYEIKYKGNKSSAYVLGIELVTLDQKLKISKVDLIFLSQ